MDKIVITSPLSLQVHLGNPKMARIPELSIKAMPECEGGGWYMPTGEAEALVAAWNGFTSHGNPESSELPTWAQLVAYWRQRAEAGMTNEKPASPTPPSGQAVKALLDRCKSRDGTETAAQVEAEAVARLNSDAFATAKGTFRAFSASWEGSLAVAICAYADGCSALLPAPAPEGMVLDAATIEACAKIADDHTPAKHEGTLAAHVTGRSIAAAIRASSPQGERA